MKAKLVPIYFRSGKDDEYVKQIETLKKLLSDEADILEAIPLGSPLPEADAVLFPQVIRDTYAQIDEIKQISLPIIIATSEFGMVNMWDWEIVNYLKSEDVTIFSPYTLDLTRSIVRSLALKREMKETSFLIFQDNPGEGMYPSIFKRFYWWEDECSERIKDKFGIRILKESFKTLGEKAKNISDQKAREVWSAWNFSTQDLTEKAILSAVKIYVALKEKIDKNSTIKGAGMNCLNESFYSDTTPCLAWCMLFAEKGLIWACEGDTMSLLTKFIVYHALHQPIMMSNVYPFLMGKAALKHEKIDHFPEVDNPANYLLVAHCGYFGLIPPSFSSEWTLRPPVLEIVDKNATAVDARFPLGPVTLTKFDSTLNKLLIVEGTLQGYKQYPGSDCRNGGIIKISDGRRLMENLYSHHLLIITGHHSAALKNLARLLDFEAQTII